MTAQILLATYNGEHYLEEQLCSIVNQSYADWAILARDDESNDNTVKILKDFKTRYPDKITILDNKGINLGARGNFIHLMQHATGDIVCFADQDDIWHPEKIKQSIDELTRMESIHGQNTPILVHHDFSVVNKAGSMQYPSFDKQYSINKTNSTLSKLLVQNVVTGFSITANRALIKKSLPAPHLFSMHDGHLGLVAQSFGEISYINKPLAKYRIHGENEVGVNAFYKGFLGDTFNPISLVKDIRRRLSLAEQKLQAKASYADAFLERYQDDLNDTQSKIFADFAKLAHVSRVERKRLIVKNKFFPSCPKLAGAFLILA